MLISLMIKSYVILKSYIFNYVFFNFFYIIYKIRRFDSRDNLWFWREKKNRAPQNTPAARASFFAVLFAYIYSVYTTRESLK